MIHPLPCESTASPFQIDRNNSIFQVNSKKSLYEYMYVYLSV